MNSIRNPGEEFEYYVERQFLLLYEQIQILYSNLYTPIITEIRTINERLTKMATLAEQLGVEETTLAEVVPKLATEISTLQENLNAREKSLSEATITLASDSAELKVLQGELAQIKSISESLSPVVEKAKELVPHPTGTETTPINPLAVEHPAETPAATSPAEVPATAETAPVEHPATAETVPTPVNPNEG